MVQLVLTQHQEFCRKISGSRRVPESAAPASPGKLLEMHVPGPHPRPRELVGGAIAHSILGFSCVLCSVEPESCLRLWC